MEQVSKVISKQTSFIFHFTTDFVPCCIHLICFSWKGLQRGKQRLYIAKSIATSGPMHAMPSESRACWLKVLKGYKQSHRNLLSNLRLRGRPNWPLSKPLWAACSAGAWILTVSCRLMCVPARFPSTCHICACLFIITVP